MTIFGISDVEISGSIIRDLDDDDDGDDKGKR
jgi:hypothetical protein